MLDLGQEANDFLRELGSERLKPSSLTKWIESKLETEVDSVYLTPVGKNNPEDDESSCFYLYTLVNSDEAMKSRHFLTLR